jgi:DNA-binding MarR family transcriptional regulator
MKHDKGRHKGSKEERKAIEARSCSTNMRQLMNAYRSLLEDSLRADGLTLPQLRLLKAVQQQTDVSAAALARTCMVTPQTLQVMLRRAVQAKWVVRGKSKKNERFVTATLTPLGEGLLQSGMAMAARIEERLWRDVGLSDLKRLNEMLKAGIAGLEAEAG